MGKYIEIYDCSRKQAVREVSGYRTVTKHRMVKRSGRRKVVTLTHRYAFKGTANIRWNAGNYSVQVSNSLSRTAQSSTGPNGRSMPSDHTVANLRKKVIDRAIKNLTLAVKFMTSRDAESRYKHAMKAALKAGDQDGWIDAQIYLIRLGQGDESSVEKALKLPAGTLLNAIEGTSGIGPPARLIPALAAMRPPKRKEIDVWDGDSRGTMLGAASIARGYPVFSQYLSYRDSQTLNVPLQGNREMGSGSFRGTFRYASPTSGLSPLIEGGYSFHVGKRTSKPHEYLDGEQEWALSGGVGLQSGWRLGFVTSRLSLFGGVRLDYSWNAIGDLHAAAWIAPFSAVAIVRIWQRYPLYVEVWGSNLFAAKDVYGAEISLQGGGGVGLFARFQQAPIDARYGGVVGDDIINIGATPIRTFDIGLQVYVF